MELRSVVRSVVRALFVSLVVTLLGGCEFFFGSDSDRPALGASVSAVPGDPQYSDQWAHPAGDSALAWGLMGIPGVAGNFEPVVVAVLDSLIDTDHPELSGNVSPGGWDFIADQSHDASMADGAITPDDHGTHVAGIIASVHGNGLGIVGVGRNYAKVLPIRVLDSSQGGTSDDLLAGILYAGGIGTNPQPSVTAQVINMSLGTPSFLGTTIENAIETVRSRGVTLIGASGNWKSGDLDGIDAIDYPAAYPGVIAVGSVDFTGSLYERSGFSEYGADLDVLAAGGVNDTNAAGILSTVPNSLLGYLQGTSMATPYVAGVAALFYAWDRGISPQEVRQILRETATDIHTPGRDSETGWGLVNANRALRRRLMAPYGPFEYDSSVSTYTPGVVSSLSEHSVTGSSIRVREDHPPESRVENSYILTVNDSRWTLLGESAASAELEAILTAAGGSVENRIGGRFWRVASSGVARDLFVESLEAWALVEMVEPNYRVTFSRGWGESEPAEEDQGLPASEPMDSSTSGQSVTVLERGGHSGVREAGSYLFRDTVEADRLPEGMSDALEKTLRNAVEEHPAVALIFAGERSTAGYSVEVQQVRRSGELLTVVYEVLEPGSGQIVAQVITSPYLMIALPEGTEQVSLIAR